MLLAKPLISLYSADWVVWFAEIQPVAGYQPQIRAPEPVRKLEPAEQGREIDLTERIQFSATISKSGQVGSVVVLKGGNTATAQAAAVKDLQSWQFAPALRDGQPIDIEVVLEIPFSDFHRQ
jgi:TonB family protein